MAVKLMKKMENCGFDTQLKRKGKKSTLCIKTRRRIAVFAHLIALTWLFMLSYFERKFNGVKITWCLRAEEGTIYGEFERFPIN